MCLCECVAEGERLIITTPQLCEPWSLPGAKFNTVVFSLHLQNPSAVHCAFCYLLPWISNPYAHLCLSISSSLWVWKTFHLRVIPRMLLVSLMYSNLYGWIWNDFCDCSKVSEQLKNNSIYIIEHADKCPSLWSWPNYINLTLFIVIYGV